MTKIRALFPATFDPIHNGHIDIASRTTKLFDHVIIAVYDRPLKTLLFSPHERLEMVEQVFKGNKNITITNYSGLTVDYCNKIDAQVIVRGLRVFSDFESEFRMALANQQLAPNIETISLITAKENTFLSSTTVREISSLGGDVSTMVPEHVVTALNKRFAESPDEKDRFGTNSLRD